MKVLGFQPWDAGSHRQVRASIDRHSALEWSWVGLPGRGARWRLRLGAAQLIAEAGEQGLLTERWDAFFATSMLDVAQLRSLMPRVHRGTPIVLYMHENQLAYPVSKDVSAQTQDRDGHLIATNLSSMLAADLVLFNSAYNRQSFLEGLPRFLSQGSDAMPHGWVEQIRAKSDIAWPPVEPIPDAVLRNPENHGYADHCRVAWPHRFEHDKGPEEFLALMERYAEPLDLQLVLLGERFRTVPQALETVQAVFKHRIQHDGWISDRTAYLNMLASCDWVISTANHEFFGIAVVEALLCGCLPWVPQRLSYPELLPKEAWDLSPEAPPEDPASLRQRIQAHLAPALAPAAVAKIDGKIEGLISGV